tara:strand:+ start:129 stop:350 length:222 start_codon:yes stop_codon:yes gene_type:complete
MVYPAYPAYPTKPGPPRLPFSEYQNDIEKQNQEALRKNNEKLDELCNKICLIIGWSLVCCLFMYVILLIIAKY